MVFANRFCAYGAFAWAHRALSSCKRRFAARADATETHIDGSITIGVPQEKWEGTEEERYLRHIHSGPKVRETPSWPRRWANFSLFELYSHSEEYMGQLTSSGPT